jgi:hypothetical protein
MTHRAFEWILVAIAASTLTACAAKQTYPPTSGSALFDPGTSPMPTLMATAITAVHKRSAIDGGEIVFNLPPGVRTHVWEDVASRLGANARPAEEGDRNVITVEEIRLDGGIAQVNVVAPTDGDAAMFQLYTVHMRGGAASAWKVTYVQPWTLRTAAPPRNEPRVGGGPAVVTETSAP